MRSDRYRGEITVYCALLFGALTSLIVTVIFSARAQVIRIKAEELMQIGLHSCAGEFNQELLALYDIFGIDVSYRGSSGIIDNVLSHFRDYVLVNIEQNALSNATSDLWKVSFENEKITGYQLLSDGDGSVLMKAISQYVASTCGFFDTAGMREMGARLAGADESSFISGFSNSLADGGAVFDNPAIDVYEMAVGADLLSMAAVSGTVQGTMSGNCIGKRTMNHGTIGNGAINRGTTGKGAGISNAEEDLAKYIPDKFGYYLSPKAHSVMECEREYLAIGEAGSRDCLKRCAQVILAQRELIQLQAIFSDEGALIEAQALAELLCSGGIGNVEKVRESLLYALAYAESVVDVSTLLAGGRIPADSASGRRVPLDGLREFTSFCPGSGSMGASYEDYLNGILWNTSQKDKLIRCMDIMELNLRANHHPGFAADGTITQIRIYMDINSEYGTSCSVEREYDYYHEQ